LFLQVVVDRAEVSAVQNCGNILAGVAPFAIEQGLVAAADGITKVRIHMVNTASVAVASVQTPGRVVSYVGSARIDGVPGTAAPVSLDFLDIAGSSCGALLPTGSVRDRVNGVDVSCIDNGMPVVLLRARDFGKTGYESPEELEADASLKQALEAIRLAIGPRMNLGDVRAKTVPKMCLVAPARDGGAICTRTFIPHRVHEAIGVLGAVSVASACVLPGSTAHELAALPGDTSGTRSYDIEHPTGYFTVELETVNSGEAVQFRRAALLRTARKLMQGQVFIPATVWDGVS
ncbi:MAG: 4-oxalomesaconate tautomerase, partial [Gammaproteobacteria bacterium]|nr:4-oxalomesaconate tautomerase [Gammaproteobacteria bacterium]